MICQNGNPHIYDKEAERLVELEDCFSELMDNVIEEQNNQKKIVKIIKEIEQPFKNILFEVYIQGKTLVTVASEMKYNYDYIKKMNKIALIKFEKATKSY